MFKIESILSHYLKLVNVSFRSASKKRKVVLDFSTPPAPNETPFDQPIPPKSANNVPSPTKREEDSFYAGLQRACPTAVALSLHAKHSDSFVPKCVSGTAPRPLDQLYDSSVPCDIYNDVLLHCATINISVTEDQVQYVVQQTVEQSQSKLWFSMRAGRVTASTFYAACHTRIEKPAMSVLRSICTPNAHRFSSAATEWGNTHESVARDQYEALHTVQHTDVVCQASGLCLSTAYPMFGASPDGLVQCTCYGEGLVEIKALTLCVKAVISVSWPGCAWLTTSTVAAGITATSSKCRCSCSWPTSRTTTSLCGRRKACSLRGFTLIGNGG